MMTNAFCDLAYYLADKGVYLDADTLLRVLPMSMTMNAPRSSADLPGLTLSQTIIIDHY
jgi:hypothetical protein